MTSKIEWTDRSDWNPIRGCTRISEGCRNCYAERLAGRFCNPGQWGAGFAVRTAKGGRWTGRVELLEARLPLPLAWRKPARIFVNSTADLFHESLPDAAIDRVFAVMALCPQHTFQVLTKRSARMRAYCGGVETMGRLLSLTAEIMHGDGDATVRHLCDGLAGFVLPNVWLGVSAEDQRCADERIPDLLATPAVVRFVSAEPLLGPIDFSNIGSSTPTSASLGLNALTGEVFRPRQDGSRTVLGNWNVRLDLVIVGGESGPHARPNWAPNVRAIVRQCAAAGVAYFGKQMGANVQDRNDAGFDGCGPRAWELADEFAQLKHNPDGYVDQAQGAPVRIRLRDRKGADPAEWPSDLRVRQLPSLAQIM